MSTQHLRDFVVGNLSANDDVASTETNLIFEHIRGSGSTVSCDTAKDSASQERPFRTIFTRVGHVAGCVFHSPSLQLCCA